MNWLYHQSPPWVFGILVLGLMVGIVAAMPERAVPPPRGPAACRAQCASLGVPMQTYSYEPWEAQGGHEYCLCVEDVSLRDSRP